jgi:predicted CXXCH cytochrome family protein
MKMPMTSCVRTIRPLGMRHTFTVRVAAVLFFLLAGAFAETPNVCLDCHSALDEPLKVRAESFAANVHAQKGLTCASCHGGDPTNSENAMSTKAGFKGKITRQQIPQLCGKCHGDAAYMRQYNPSLRTDQLAQYRTSVHGQKLAAGDTKVAVCTDCHSVHEIRAASDTRSTVNPLNVAATCGHCHADAAYMKPYAVPVTQFAAYSKSVHHEAMVERGDLSAPTCSTCHGNHGAAPPGVASVKNVCSTCHIFQSQLFDQSPHKVAFEVASLPGCVTCHSNHRIEPASDALVGTDDNAICRKCHSGDDPGLKSAADIRSHLEDLRAQIAKSTDILDRAAQSGMEVSQSQLELIQANDALTKARVAIHSFRSDAVEKEVSTGKVVTKKTYQAGLEALRERNYRRAGLSISLLIIGVTLIGLRLWIHEIEH